jgi:hypothetical protein
MICNQLTGYQRGKIFRIILDILRGNNPPEAWINPMYDWCDLVSEAWSAHLTISTREYNTSSWSVQTWCLSSQAGPIVRSHRDGEASKSIVQSVLLYRPECAVIFGTQRRSPHVGEPL